MQNIQKRLLNYTSPLKMHSKKEEIERLERQVERLKKNFSKMVQESDEADKMLDWINEIRRRIERLKKEL